jgi:hypothetical protein
MGTSADMWHQNRARQQDAEAREQELLEAQERALVHDDLVALAAHRLAPQLITFMDDDDDMGEVFEDDFVATRAALRCELDRGHIPHVTEVW